MSFWNILDIDPTNDVTIIKKAYAKKLKIYHPEDDPEGFQKLREAYESALKYSKSLQNKNSNINILKDKVINSPPIDLLDEIIYDTPNNINAPPHVNHWDKIVDRTHNFKNIVIQFINEAQILYDNFFLRINIENWRVLLNSEAMWHMGDKAFLNHKMIEFLIVNHHLPKEVWQLLELNFHWMEQENYLYKHYPEEFIKYLFKQINQVFELRYCYFKAIEGIDYDEFLSHRETAFYALIDNDLELAEKSIVAAYAIYTDDPDLLRIKGEYYLRIGNTYLALNTFNYAIKANADDIDEYFYRAKILYDSGEILSALEDCKYLQVHMHDNLDVLYLLAKCHFKLGDLYKAKELFLHLLEINPFEIEAKTYLAQINLQLAKKLQLELKKDHFNSEAKLKLKNIYDELGEPRFKKTSAIFFKILIKKISFVALIFIFQIIILILLTAPSKNSIIINRPQDIYKISSKVNNIQINISNAKFILYHLTKRDNNHKTITMYLPLQEIKRQNLLNYIDGYIYISNLADKKVIVIVNRHQSDVLNKTGSLSFNGTVYNTSDENLSKSIMKAAQLNNMPKEVTDGLIVSKYIGKHLMETWQPLIILLIIAITLCLQCLIIVHAIVTAYKWVKFKF